MDNFLSKFSSYNIFNYLLPGYLFIYVMRQLWGYNFSVESGEFENAFVAYFWGLVVSRIGSFYIEPLLDVYGYRTTCSYKNYTEALLKDTDIANLSEMSNVYRSLLSLACICCLLSIFFSFTVLDNKVPIIEQFKLIKNNLYFCLFAVVMACLFAKSYKKQNNYINMRVNAVLNKNSSV